MRAADLQRAGPSRSAERPDPVIEEPTDAVVRVVLACVCGSDLWYCRGIRPRRRARSATSSSGSSKPSAPRYGVAAGDLVDRPVHLQRHVVPALLERVDDRCVQGGNFGNGTIDGGQGEAVRVPLAGTTLVQGARLGPLRRRC